MTAPREGLRDAPDRPDPTEAPVAGRARAAEEAGPPRAAPAPGGEEPPELHRVASTALVAGALTGPAGAAAFAAVSAALDKGHGPSPAEALVCAAALGVCAAFLAGCAGLALRVRRWLRPPLILAASAGVMMIGGLGGGWVHGFLAGGHEAAWEELRRSAADAVFGPKAWLTACCAVLFLVLAAPRAGLLPGGRRGLLVQAAAGAVGGVAYLLVALVVRGRSFGAVRGHDLLFAVGMGLTLGLALGLADRLESRLAATLSRRLGPQEDA